MLGHFVFRKNEKKHAKLFRISSQISNTYYACSRISKGAGGKPCDRGGQGKGEREGEGQGLQQRPGPGRPGRSWIPRRRPGEPRRVEERDVVTVPVVPDVPVAHNVPAVP